MNNYIFNNVPPRIYTLSSMVVGYALIGDMTAGEQNAWGNWFMTVGQILEANAAFQQVIEQRIQGNTININSKQAKCGGDVYMHNPPLTKQEQSNEDILKQLQKIINTMQKEINNLKEKN